jgi:hypothetical protein
MGDPSFRGPFCTPLQLVVQDAGQLWVRSCLSAFKHCPLRVLSQLLLL